MKITNRYGVKVKGEYAAYGTNDVKKARSAAQRWGGKVVDLSAIGRKAEKSGTTVDYTYRKKKCNRCGRTANTAYNKPYLCEECAKDIYEGV